MAGRGSELYRFVADRYEERMQHGYGGGGAAAVREYADAFRQAQGLHRDLAQALAAGDAPAADRSALALAALAQPWAGHRDYPPR
ncbi:hypothetical protein [Streptacidiphilus sp. EB103A]|uniref:hypothetical protein n=1 Tax=Streptacidiphilus sp. EB103A TaxID=3156275 RepID=UPI0035175499